MGGSQFGVRFPPYPTLDSNGRWVTTSTDPLARMTRACVLPARALRAEGLLRLEVLRRARAEAEGGEHRGAGRGRGAGRQALFCLRKFRAC